MTNATLLTFGDMVIDATTQTVTRRGKKIFLRRKEYQLLEFLVMNKNRVVNRLTILEYVWNYSARVNTNTLDVHMATLRKKINRRSTKIKTVYGIGYSLLAQ